MQTVWQLYLTGHLKNQVDNHNSAHASWITLHTASNLKTQLENHLVLLSGSLRWMQDSVPVNSVARPVLNTSLH